MNCELRIQSRAIGCAFYVRLISIFSAFASIYFGEAKKNYLSLGSFFFSVEFRSSNVVLVPLNCPFFCKSKLRGKKYSLLPPSHRFIIRAPVFKFERLMHGQDMHRTICYRQSRALRHHRNSFCFFSHMNLSRLFRL